MLGLDKVGIEISVVLGGRTLCLREVLRLGKGAMIDLDMLDDNVVELRANAHPIALGRIMTYPDGRVGIEVGQILSQPALPIGSLA